MSRVRRELFRFQRGRDSRARGRRGRIPLALGGGSSDERNIELQPWDEAGEKDRIETCLSRAVCAGTITLDEARWRIWADWRVVGTVCQ